MKLPRSKKKRAAFSTAGMELAGALSIASQMALFCPPGFDELVRRELMGDAEAARREPRPADRRLR
jgi:hypothetical protein